MRAQPSTQFELSLGFVFDVPVVGFKTCAQDAQILERKILISRRFQVDSKRTSLSELAFYPNISAKQLAQMLDDRQP